MTDHSNSFLIGVQGETAGQQAAAAALAQRLHLPLATAGDGRQYAYLLLVTPRRLELRAQGPAAHGPVYVDFLHGAAAYRRRTGDRRQPLARAVGLRGGSRPTVLDPTAGLGGDAFVLACLGCTVQMVERSPIIAALLDDGLERAAADAGIGPLVRERLSLAVADGNAFMASVAEARRPEVVYLDPMYPPRTKAALGKKELRVLRDLVGDDDDAPALLAAALACARRRVVVKRPRHAPAIAGEPPDQSLAGASTRFDLYFITASGRRQA